MKAHDMRPISPLVSAIRAARRERGFTLAKVSQLSGLNLSQISQIENGRVDVRLSSLQALANALDLALVVTGRSVPAATSPPGDPPSVAEHLHLPTQPA